MPDGGGNEGFLAMRRRFDQAASSSPGALTSRCCTVAGRSLSFTLAGAMLKESIAPSLVSGPQDSIRHAGAPTVGDNAAVLLWDCEATAIERPEPPTQGEWIARGEGWRVSLHGSGRYLCEERLASLLWLDRQQAQLIGCFATGTGLGCADRARPLQRMMSEFCRSLGIQEIHAALVGWRGRGVLLAGAGGRGKTTASLDGLHEGLQFLGDDSVAIGEDADGRLLGYRLYASARVRTSQLGRWPAFKGHWQMPEPPEEKALLLPGTFLPGRLAGDVRIAAIVLPAVTGNGLRLERISGVAAFHALVHESRDNRRFGLTAREFARLARMTREIPCYRLEVDRDPGRVADALRELAEAA